MLHMTLIVAVLLLKWKKEVIKLDVWSAILSYPYQFGGQNDK